MKAQKLYYMFYITLAYKAINKAMPVIILHFLKTYVSTANRNVYLYILFIVLFYVDGLMRTY